MLFIGVFLFAVIFGEMDRIIPVHKECRKEGHIAFTFDQGPSQHTGILLSSLASAGVKATFHVIPDYLDNPVISANLRRAANDGHLIGLYVSEAVVEDSLKDYLLNATRKIKNYINYAPTFLRFAGGNPPPSVLKMVHSMGYQVTSYNLDSQDYNSIEGNSKEKRGAVFQSVQSTLDLIIPPTLGSFIVVQRDIVPASVAQTGEILAYAKERGYKAVRLDACIGAKDVAREVEASKPNKLIKENNDNNKNAEEETGTSDHQVIGMSSNGVGPSGSPSRRVCGILASGLMAMII